MIKCLGQFDDAVSATKDSTEETLQDLFSEKDFRIHDDSVADNLTADDLASRTGR